jgi:hypothetical protein
MMGAMYLNDYSLVRGLTWGPFSTGPLSRLEGSFGFPNGDNDYQTIEVKNNAIECIGRARPLFRQAHSHAAVVENNTPINVADTESYGNPDTRAPRGLAEVLHHDRGVNGQFGVNDWEGRASDRVSEESADRIGT